MKVELSETRFVIQKKPQRTRPGSTSSQHGMMTSIIIGSMAFAGLIGFAMVYNLSSRLRENSEQDRMARSAAIVAVKAYLRAAAQHTPIPQRKQITYALDAAARVVNVDSGTSDPIAQLTTPSQSRSSFEASTEPMPQTPITVVLADKDEDSEGNTMAAAQLTLGTATVSGSSYTLGPFSGTSSQDLTIGARVFINGLSRSSRVPIFSRYFGTPTLARSKSQVLVVYDHQNASQNPAEAVTIIEETPSS